VSHPGGNIPIQILGRPAPPRSSIRSSIRPKPCWTQPNAAVAGAIA